MSWSDLDPTLVIALTFIFAALLLLTTLQHTSLRKQEGKFSATFARLYGLLVIAGLGVTLALSADIAGDAQSAAYTLLGIVAGYLAGGRPSATSGGDPVASNANPRPER
jgi:hypothetical protein